MAKALRLPNQAISCVNNLGEDAGQPTRRIWVRASPGRAHFLRLQLAGHFSIPPLTVRGGKKNPLHEKLSTVLGAFSGKRFTCRANGLPRPAGRVPQVSCRPRSAPGRRGAVAGGARPFPPRGSSAPARPIGPLERGQVGGPQPRPGLDARAAGAGEGAGEGAGRRVHGAPARERERRRDGRRGALKVPSGRGPDDRATARCGRLEACQGARQEGEPGGRSAVSTPAPPPRQGAPGWEPLSELVRAQPGGSKAFCGARSLLVSDSVAEGRLGRASGRCCPWQPRGDVNSWSRWRDRCFVIPEGGSGTSLRSLKPCRETER